LGCGAPAQATDRALQSSSPEASSRKPAARARHGRRAHGMQPSSRARARAEVRLPLDAGAPRTPMRLPGPSLDGWHARLGPGSARARLAAVDLGAYPLVAVTRNHEAPLHSSNRRGSIAGLVRRGARLPAREAQAE